MVGKDIFYRKTYIDFPVPVCIDGSLMFFKRFENETNDRFIIYFYDDEKEAVAELWDQWFKVLPRCHCKLWDMTDLLEITKHANGDIYEYAKKKWFVTDVEVVIDDNGSNWGREVRIDHFSGVMPVSYDSNYNCITFEYNFYITDRVYR